jgi:hypothetical protein
MKKRSAPCSFFWQTVLDVRLPGTRMPAWNDKISDTGRWNLVNYLRFLAQSTQ